MFLTIQFYDFVRGNWKQKKKSWCQSEIYWLVSPVKAERSTFTLLGNEILRDPSGLGTSTWADQWVATWAQVLKFCLIDTQTLLLIFSLITVTSLIWLWDKKHKIKWHMSDTNILLSMKQQNSFSLRLCMKIMQ